jgi:hypothetical protein
VSNPMSPEPMPPIRGEQQPAKPAVPKEINIAFAVWVLSTLVSMVMEIIDADAIVEIYMRQMTAQAPDMQLSPETVRNMFLVIVVLVNLVLLLFAWKMRQGRNWARILLTVLAVLSLWSQAASVGMSSVLGLISVVITATGLVFMFVPAANAYFAAVKQQRLNKRR